MSRVERYDESAAACGAIEHMNKVIQETCLCHLLQVLRARTSDEGTGELHVPYVQNPGWDEHPDHVEEDEVEP